LFNRLLPILPVAMCLAFAMPVKAQSRVIFGRGLVSAPGYFGPGPNWNRNPGPGVGSGYYGVTGSPTAFVDVGYAWGFGIPAASGSFWTNGLSLYGPPIPTYGPVPGTFGGSDAHRFYSNPPILGYGLHAFGYRSPIARLAAPSVSVYPESAPVALPAPTVPSACRVEVRLPDAGAELWINKTKTSSTGVERSFESPELTEGKSFEYELIARWENAGEKKAESRKVTVAAGKSVLVDFRGK